MTLFSANFISLSVIVCQVSNPTLCFVFLRYKQVHFELLLPINRKDACLLQKRYYYFCFFSLLQVQDGSVAGESGNLFPGDELLFVNEIKCSSRANAIETIRSIHDDIKLKVKRLALFHLVISLFYCVSHIDTLPTSR